MERLEKLVELLQRYAGKSVQSSVDERKETTTVVSKPAINDEQKSLTAAELPININDWSKYWREAYEERATIMEYDGGLSRVEAEKQAEKRIREKYKEIKINNVKFNQKSY